MPTVGKIREDMQTRSIRPEDSSNDDIDHEAIENRHQENSEPVVEQKNYRYFRVVFFWLRTHTFKLYEAAQQALKRA